MTISTLKTLLGCNKHKPLAPKLFAPPHIFRHRVKNVLPLHAQEIYLEAFNSAWDQYDEPDERRGNSSREETAQCVA
jgi:hypothetical protein